ncbi:MAG TPA: molecular chaperone [Pseudomonadales bacterium]|nr:molecular chaperone [Pseudomonadales bacterium]
MIGIDWGTSTSSIAHAGSDGAAVRLLDIGADGGTRVPSTVWVPREPRFDAPPDDIGRAMVLAPELIRRGALRFGAAATDAMLRGDDSGFYVKSPKSFLGAELRDRQIDNFTALVERMLGHLLDRAEQTLGTRPTRAVIGRPVRYHGTRGEAGNAQAMAVMEAAARGAGLEEARFLLEPVAAAYAYENTLARERLALIVDAGGGTTDLTLMRLGPQRAGRRDREADVLATAGDRLGGTDLDARLAFRSFTPALGRETLLETGLPIPSHHYVDLCGVADVNAQTRFGSAATGAALADYLARARAPDALRRLQHVHATGASFRLNRTSEATKIALSDADPVTADLAWTSPDGADLSLVVERSDLAWAALPLLERVGHLAAEIEAQAGARPDVVFVTGGTALSPVVADGLRARLGGAELVVGDLFGSVAAGLGLAAAR